MACSPDMAIASSSPVSVSAAHVASSSSGSNASTTQQNTDNDKGEGRKTRTPCDWETIFTGSADECREIVKSDRLDGKPAWGPDHGTNPAISRERKQAWLFKCVGKKTFGCPAKLRIVDDIQADLSTVQRPRSDHEACNHKHIDYLGKQLHPSMKAAVQDLRGVFLSPSQLVRAIEVKFNAKLTEVEKGQLKNFR